MSNTKTKATVIGLKDARERLGLTQLQVAYRAEVSPPVITLLEKGLHVKVSTAKKVADVFSTADFYDPSVRVAVGGCP